MAHVLLTSATHPTLAAVAADLRTIVAALHSQPRRRLIRRLEDLADDLDWFVEAYQEREHRRKEHT